MFIKTNGFYFINLVDTYNNTPLYFIGFLNLNIVITINNSISMNMNPISIFDEMLGVEQANVHIIKMNSITDPK